MKKILVCLVTQFVFIDLIFSMSPNRILIKNQSFSHNSLTSLPEKQSIQDDTISEHQKKTLENTVSNQTSEPELESKILASIENNKDHLIIISYLKNRSFSQDYLKKFILKAAEKRNEKVVNLLLQNRDLPQDFLEEFIIKFIEKNNEEAVNSLLEKTEFSQDFLEKFIVKAIEKGNKKAVRSLLANKDFSQNCLTRSIAAATGKGDKELFELLLQKGTDLHKEIDDSHNTLLHIACVRGQMEMVQLLLQHNVKINTVNKFRQTPLEAAVLGQDDKIVKLLLEKGAHSCSQVFSLLDTALRHCDEDIISLLLEKGVDAQYLRAEASNILVDAICDSDWSKIEQLLKHDRYLNFNQVHYHRNDTALTAALRIRTNSYLRNINYRRNDLIDTLLKKANIHQTDKYGSTTLLVAAECGDLDRVRYFLQQGVDVNKANNYGETPLSVAIENNHQNIVDLLLQKGALIYAENDKKPKLFTAVCKCHRQVIQFLLKEGADIDQGVDGITPLHQAIFYGYTDIVKLLLKNGADIHIEQPDGSTAHDLAIAKNRLNEALFLKFYEYMLDKALIEKLFFELKNINLEEINKDIPLRYIPVYLSFIAKDDKEIQEAQNMFNAYLHLQNAQNNVELTDDDSCCSCLKTKKELQGDPKNIALFKNECCSEFMCVSCYFNAMKNDY